MIYLGDTMASRMERYYNDEAKTTRRSQRNQVLYDQIDELQLGSSLKRERGLETTRIERLFESYDAYKEQEKRDKTYELENKKEHYTEDDIMYQMLLEMNQNTEEHLQKKRFPKGISNEEDQKIRELISTITATNRVEKRYKNENLDIVRDLYKPRKKEENSKKNIDFLLEQAKFLVQKKRNEIKLKEMNRALYPYNERTKEEMQKLHLKIKYGSLILFFIFSFIILLLLFMKTMK